MCLHRRPPVDALASNARGKDVNVAVKGVQINNERRRVQVHHLLAHIWVARVAFNLRAGDVRVIPHHIGEQQGHLDQVLVIRLVGEARRPDDLAVLAGLRPLSKLDPHAPGRDNERALAHLVAQGEVHGRVLDDAHARRNLLDVLQHSHDVLHGERNVGEAHVDELRPATLGHHLVRCLELEDLNVLCKVVVAALKHDAVAQRSVRMQVEDLGPPSLASSWLRLAKHIPVKLAVEQVNEPFCCRACIRYDKANMVLAHVAWDTGDPRCSSR
mmetsp:Transcript_12166/g.48912  ORF Transcript_12166/g.48912 Transcript_12166/m.48912 type:complete len:271 (+) Transcript_12166:993-1805(+)